VCGVEQQLLPVYKLHMRIGESLPFVRTRIRPHLLSVLYGWCWYLETQQTNKQKIQNVENFFRVFRVAASGDEYIAFQKSICCPCFFFLPSIPIEQLVVFATPPFTLLLNHTHNNA
jgi:hypothetical protein